PGDLGRDRRHRRDDRTAGGDRLVAAAVHRSRCGHGPGGARSRPLRRAAAPDRARRAPADRAPPHGARGMGRAAHRGARRDRGADRSACRPGRSRPGALRHAVPPLGAEAHPRHRQRLEPRAPRRGHLRPPTDALPRGLPCSGLPGVPSPIVLNGAVLALALGPWMLGSALLARVTFPRVSWAPPVVAVVVTLIPASPVDLWIHLSPVPNLVGFAALPGALAAAAALWSAVAAGPQAAVAPGPAASAPIAADGADAAPRWRGILAAV